jgi:hypothetical protein
MQDNEEQKVLQIARQYFPNANDNVILSAWQEIRAKFPEVPLEFIEQLLPNIVQEINRKTSSKVSNKMTKTLQMMRK